MSRIGKAPIPLPGGVDVAIDPDVITVKGPKGTLTQANHSGVTIAVADGEVLVTRPDDERQSRQLHGLYRTLIANMVTGVNEGFSRTLDIVGVGYRAAMQGSGIKLQLGFSHDVIVDAPEGITFEVPTPTQIIIRGISKQQVGQVAANIRKIRPPEPYKGKGVRYQGETILRKAGKAAG